MADEPESQSLKRKRKHSRDLNDGKERATAKSSKRNPKVKNKQTVQPKLPKTATEMSSNWKLLQAVSTVFFNS